jgi:hypothetical protein
MAQDSVEVVENFWREVWTQPQNPDGGMGGRSRWPAATQLGRS